MSKMKKYIPSILKPPLMVMYILFRCLLRGSLDGKSINLAGVLPSPLSEEIVHGGKVKLLALRERFGDSWKGFKLAYFVSSGLPYAPAIWLRLYKLFGIRIVWNQNGVAYPALYSQRIVKRVNDLYKPIKLSDYVVYQTEFTRRCADKFIKKYNGPYSILINPVDTKHFKPRSTPLPHEPLTILMAGNHFESIDRMTASLLTIKELLNKGVQTKLIIIGKSEDYTDGEIEKLGLSAYVEKRGSFLQDEAPTLFQSAHILLHLKYLDPCPTIVLEAMSCGLPVVAGASGGLPEMVSGDSGILMPIAEDFDKLHYPDPESVAEAILKINNSLDTFSKSARVEAVEKFDKELWLTRHEDIFKSLCR